MAYQDLNVVHNPSTGTAPPATWGDQVRDNFEFLVSTPMCTIAGGSSQAVTTGSTGEALTGTETIDTASMHSGSSATITMPIDGKYLLVPRVQFDNGSVNRCRVHLAIEGTDYIIGQVPPIATTYGIYISGAMFYDATAGDEAECWAIHDKGSDLNVELLEFTVKWMGR